MANTKMGFEGQLYYGVAGSTASTLLENTKDITVTRDVERGDTTVRGDSSAPPIGTGSVTKRMVNVEFTMIHDITDTAFAALKQASANGTGVALRGKDHSSGKGPDADYTLSHGDPWPLAGEQVVTFTAEPTRDYGRAPQSYV
jgi:hypothetical protein